MNVLILSLHRDRRISAQANWLAGQGHDVTFATLSPAFVCEELEETVRVVLPPAEEDVAPPRRKGTWGRVRRKIRLSLPIGFSRFLLQLYSCLFQVHRRFLPAFAALPLEPAPSFDVIHAHDLPSFLAGASLRHNRYPRAALVYDMHEWTPEQYDHALIRLLVRREERRWIGRADAVITVNEFLADRIAASYGIARPIVLLNSYASRKISETAGCSREEFRAHFALENDRFCFLFQGGLEPGRNLENLLEAFRHVPEANLLLLGTGTLRESLIRRKENLGVRNIHFGNAVPQPRLISFTRRADAGILCYTARNRNSLYCTPNKLFEYLEAEIPICASDLPAVRSFVAATGVGKVYDMNSVPGIVAAAKDFMTAVRRGDFPPESRRAAREKYGFSRQAEVLRRLYDSLRSGADER